MKITPCNQLKHQETDSDHLLASSKNPVCNFLVRFDYASSRRKGSSRSKAGLMPDEEASTSTNDPLDSTVPRSILRKPANTVSNSNDKRSNRKVQWSDHALGEELFQIREIEISESCSVSEEEHNHSADECSGRCRVM